MTRWVEIRNSSQGGQHILRARWCQSFFCRLRGLSFRRALQEGTGLLLINSRASWPESTIHMWWVFFPLGVVWLDASLVVVDTKLAQPWKFYLPGKPASYILEGSPSILESVKIGDRLEIIDEIQD
jgi:uncharacterized membrane protein (UPF0127 family)